MTALLSILVLAAGPFGVPADTPAQCIGEPAVLEMAVDFGVGEKAACNATADCGEYQDVSCSGNNNCTAYDRNCPYQRGYVVCDGNYTYCPVCPPSCTQWQCRQGCYCPGGFSACIDRVYCICECIYP